MSVASESGVRGRSSNLRFARIWAVPRFVVAAAIVAAVVVTYQGSHGFWIASGFDDLVTLNVNFFSYFTIESNLLAAAVLTLGAVFALVGRVPDLSWFGLLRACAATYMAITGIVYNLLLRGIPVTGGGDTPPWTNEVLHVWAPILLVIDWLVAPGRIRLAWSQVWIVIAFPIVWVAYTLIRGPLVFDQVKGVETWYPYPFLNPATQENGYVSVAFWVVVIAIAFVAVASLVVWVTRIGTSRPVAESTV
ncbi:Pr6Pr family membrane protein [Agromyces sp. LHK192]|uniref:Pr6Pr family membrane protein n=1 Tax=Agromyces sp. LHK192 TaxID=2498704 RepID=UPI001F0C2E9B|nr:Pr6Pr family membrane protein [Agromyces sp. LHK192]